MYWYRLTSGKHFLDQADYVAPARQRELDHAEKGSIGVETSTADNQVGIDPLPEMWQTLNGHGMYAPPVLLFIRPWTNSVNLDT